MNAKKRLQALTVASGECWIWQGAIHKTTGHGFFWLNGVSIVAHVASWKLYYGDIPDGYRVIQKCGQKLCVNPEHLVLSDDWNKAFGEQHGLAKLSDDMVLQIRQLYAQGWYNQAKLAKLYGISQMNVSRIVNHKIWKHI